MNKIILIFIIATITEAKVIDIIHYDPFLKAKIILQTDTKMPEPSVYHPKRFSISAILNNKVYINGKFYKKNDIIYGYKIVRVSDKYIRVIKNNKNRIIWLIKPHNFSHIISEVR